MHVYTYGVFISTAFSYLASFMFCFMSTISQPLSTDETMAKVMGEGEETAMDKISYAIQYGFLKIYNGDYAGAVYGLLNELDIDENEIDTTSLIIKLAFMKGEFKKFLVAKDAQSKSSYTGSMFEQQDCQCDNNNNNNNQQAEDNQEVENQQAENQQDGVCVWYCANFNGQDNEGDVTDGEVIDDWEEFLTEFFYGIGLYDEVNLNELNQYILAELYNRELDFFEFSCQTAMIEHFGENEAVKRGFSDQKHMQSYLAAAGVQTSTLTAGAIAGIAIAVAAVVVAVVGIAYKSGKTQNDKKLPLVAGDQGNYQEHTDPSTGSSALSRFRTLANFGGVKMSVAR